MRDTKVKSFMKQKMAEYNELKDEVEINDKDTIEYKHQPIKKIDHLMNIPLKVIATRIDKNRGNVCTSRRAVLEKSKHAEVKEVLKNLKKLN